MSEKAIFSAGDDAIKWLGAQIAKNFEATVSGCAERSRLAIDMPTLPDIADILSVVFWSSLKKEEGRLPRACVFFGAPRSDFPQWIFASKLLLDSDALAKLASGTDSERCYVGIERSNDGQLQMWGISPEPVTHGMWVQVVGPGHLLVKLQTRTIAILKPGNKPILLSEPGGHSAVVFVQHWLQSKFPKDFHWEHVEAILRIAKIMAARQMGGTLLIVRSGDDDWKPHISHNYLFSKSPSLAQSFSSFQAAPHARLSGINDVSKAWDLLDWAVLGYEHNMKERWLAEIEKCIGVVARISSIDGAVIMDSSLSMLEVGAKIAVALDVDSIAIWQPNGPEQEKLTSIETVPLSKFGGTRHQSAAKFVAAYPKGVAIVASQDGRLTLFFNDGAQVFAFKLEDLI